MTGLAYGAAAAKSEGAMKAPRNAGASSSVCSVTIGDYDAGFEPVRESHLDKASRPPGALANGAQRKQVLDESTYQKVG